MNVMEYSAKEIFQQYGIPTPEGYMVTSPEEIEEVLFPVVVKAQVQTGGRGKAGGIKFAGTTDEAREVAAQILGMDIKGHTVRKLLIERRLNVDKELYLGFVVDRSARKVRCLASAEGGMDIESVPKDKLFSYSFHLEDFLSTEAMTKMINMLGLCGIHNDTMVETTERLYKLFTELDATLVEINPLVITHEGELIAADAKLVIDNDALWRHTDLPAPEDEYTPLEQRARADGIAFVQLDGDIGVIANGAGLTMATLDALRSVGGDGGVFLDLGGTDDPEQVKKAFRLMKDAQPRVVLLHIFGGITKCDTVAIGIRDVLEEECIEAPVVARIKGRNEELARQILKDAGLIAAKSLREAAKLATEAEGGGC
jgi:succinyl-CoA synthetase beta subunit